MRVTECRVGILNATQSTKVVGECVCVGAPFAMPRLSTRRCLVPVVFRLSVRLIAEEHHAYEDGRAAEEGQRGNVG